MKRIIAIIMTSLAVCFSAAALEVDLDLSYHAVTNRSFNVEDNGKLTGPSIFGTTADAQFYFGDQSDSIVSCGLNVTAGFDVGREVSFDGATLDDSIVSFSFFTGAGVAVRIQPLDRVSFLIAPGIVINGFGYGYFPDSDSEYVAVTAPYAFDLNLGAHLWVTDRFGFNAGMNLQKVIYGKLDIENHDNVNDKTTRHSFDVDGGNLMKFYFGVSWALGRN